MEDFKPAIGRIVHFVLSEGRGQGEHRPAIIVRVWDQHEHGGVPLVNLQVFTDQLNDGIDAGTAWRTSVPFDAEKGLGSWHWPERVF
jgi:hypothetical protein